jgi:hypothetical protein
MSNINSEYHSKQIGAEQACAHCEGIFEHAFWCARRDPRIAYAYQIVADASKLTAWDSLILHSLGVAWLETSR